MLDNIDHQKKVQQKRLHKEMSFHLNLISDITSEKMYNVMPINLSLNSFMDIRELQALIIYDEYNSIYQGVYRTHDGVMFSKDSTVFEPFISDTLMFTQESPILFIVDIDTINVGKALICYDNEQFVNNIENLTTESLLQLKKEQVYIKDTATDMIIKQSLLILLFLLVLLVLTLYIIKSLIRDPINKLMVSAQNIANGELNYTIDYDGEHEIAILGKNFHIMRNKIVSQIEELTSEIQHRKEAEQEISLLNKTLERKVEERTQELKKAQKELIENAHNAGMSEIAVNMMHNVGNVLNTLFTAAQVSSNLIKESKLHLLLKANKKLTNYSEQLITNTPEYKDLPKLIELYIHLGKIFTAEHEKHNQQIERLMNAAQTISEIVKKQQKLTTFSEIYEDIEIEELIDSLLSAHTPRLRKHNIDIRLNFNNIKILHTSRSKMSYVISALLSNAIDSVIAHVNSSFSYIGVSLSLVEQEYIITIEDNGIGIQESEKTAIFLQGNSSSKKGKGVFTLHTCANYMSEMGGSISLKDNKHNSGVTFIITQPIYKNKKES